MDVSSHGLFVPSVDFSYHPRTFRTIVRTWGAHSGWRLKANPCRVYISKDTLIPASGQAEVDVRVKHKTPGDKPYLGYVENSEIPSLNNVFSARSLIPAQFSDIKISILNVEKRSQVIPKGTEIRTSMTDQRRSLGLRIACGRLRLRMHTCRVSVASCSDPSPRVDDAFKILETVERQLHTV